MLAFMQPVNLLNNEYKENGYNNIFNVQLAVPIPQWSLVFFFNF